LARARELLGLPPEQGKPIDPLWAERQRVEAARRELTAALTRANAMLEQDALPPAGQKPG